MPLACINVVFLGKADAYTCSDNMNATQKRILDFQVGRDSDLEKGYAHPSGEKMKGESKLGITASTLLLFTDLKITMYEQSTGKQHSCSGIMF